MVRSKVRIKPRGNISKRFAAANKLRNVMRARGHGVSVRLNATATTTVYRPAPAKDATMTIAPSTRIRRLFPWGGTPLTPIDPRTLAPAPTIVQPRDMISSVPTRPAVSGEMVRPLPAAAPPARPATATPRPTISTAQWNRLLTISPNMAGYRGDFDPWIAGGLSSKSPDEVENYLRNAGV